MIVPIGSHTLAVPAIAAVATRRPHPEEVSGVVVTPPRESRVAVRVEVADGQRLVETEREVVRKAIELINN